MGGWRATLWRRNVRGDWFEVRTFPPEELARALEEVNRLNAAGPDFCAVLPAGDIPTT